MNHRTRKGFLLPIVIALMVVSGILITSTVSWLAATNTRARQTLINEQNDWIAKAAIERAAVLGPNGNPSFRDEWTAMTSQSRSTTYRVTTEVEAADQLNDQLCRIQIEPDTSQMSAAFRKIELWYHVRDQ